MTQDLNQPEQFSRDFKGIWISREIWLLKELSIQEKILLIEIDSLYNKKYDGCFASNEYLSEFIGVKERQLQNMLCKLKTKGYLIQVSFDGKMRILKAIIPTNNLTEKGCNKLQGGCNKMHPWGAESCTPPIIEEKQSVVVVGENEKNVVSCVGQTLTKDDIYSAGLRYGWSPEEIEEAWKRYSNSKHSITNPLKYIEGIINKLRQNKQIKNQKDNSCKKTQTNSQPKSVNVSRSPMVKDTPESHLAQFCSLLGLS